MKKSKTVAKATLPPQSVAEAERILESLLAKRAELEASAVELNATRETAAFRAHTGDGEHQLVSVTRAIREHTAEAESLDLAIHAGRNRIMAAKAHEANIADRANASAVLEVCDALEKAGLELGAAAKTFSETSRQVSSLLQQLRSYGITSPSGEQFRILGNQALRTMISASLWSWDYPALPPGDRRDFAALIGGWTQSIRARVRGRIGAKEAA